MGRQHSRRVGLRHHEFRLVDRNRPRRNTDLRNSAASPNQSWRNSINRFAEAMTLFAVACAGMFPLLHLGRAWIFYWLFPYPNTMTVQPQFRSPLVWDVFAVSTYATVSLLFWYLGMIPDLAPCAIESKSRLKYCDLRRACLGWRGASQALALSPDGIVCCWPAWRRRWCFRFTPSSASISQSPFCPAGIPPSFRPTSLPARSIPASPWCWCSAFRFARIYGLQNLITERHLNNCAKLMLATGLMLAYTYAIEPFTAWYSGDTYEMAVVHNRAVGPIAWSYWAVILLQRLHSATALVPQSPRSVPSLCSLVSIVVLIGMWLERYMIIVTSLDRDYVPSSWTNFVATGWDNATFYGSLGFFLVLFLLFVRFLPMISISEVRELLPMSAPDGGTLK